ncbi:DUF5357 family protein [Lyngbya sp. CCY1209]|jgi:hypothetical protein|uniref:DUF5357 family protein n=1 Tax=Lyngbya sp. CCY1209 TaxID=2886103 RepID=UPI002D202201|nr:DUF5357 family protein [Lyngbya sp. CCY1209]MEB3886904.1 DUF5357 domain-containing protein [Lyngbya sp. CCY1209]
MDNPLNHPAVKNVTSFVNTIRPPRLYHWRSAIFFGLLAWLLSLLIVDNNPDRGNALAAFSWIVLTVAIAWRTTQPPFVIRGVPLSPWIAGTLITILIYQETADEMPEFAITVWPIICGCLIFFIELIQVRFKVSQERPWVRGPFLLLILAHVVLSCWIALYFFVDEWVEEYPNLFRQQILIDRAQVGPFEGLKS